MRHYYAAVDADDDAEDYLAGDTVAEACAVALADVGAECDDADGPADGNCANCDEAGDSVRRPLTTRWPRHR